jgi:uncharacterized protein
MRMKRIVSGAVALGMMGAAPAAGQDVALALAPGETLLKVEAEGEALSRPDMMEIEAAVVTTGSNARDALRANSALAERLIEAVRAAGVEARDVRTSDLSVRPRVKGGEDDDEAARPRILGYLARNSLSVRLRDLARTPEILEALLEAGANEVDGPTFRLADPKSALEAARRDAIAKARAEAETYSDALGMRIARVLNVSERREDYGRGGEIIVTGTRRNNGPPVEPGELATEVTVWIDYALAPK